MELPPLVQRVIADITGYRTNMDQAADILRGFARGSNQGIQALTDQFNDLQTSVREFAQSLGNVNPSSINFAAGIERQIDRIRRAMNDPELRKGFANLLNIGMSPGMASQVIRQYPPQEYVRQQLDRQLARSYLGNLPGIGRGVLPFGYRNRDTMTSEEIKQELDNQLARSYLGGRELSARDNAGGGFAKKFTSAFFIYHQLQEFIHSIEQASTAYIKAVVEANAQAATALMGGMRTAADGLIRGVGRTFSGFLAGITQGLDSLMKGGEVGEQIAAVGGSVQELLGGVSDALTSLVHGGTEAVSGGINAHFRRLIGGYQTGGAIGSTIGSGLTTAGGAAMLGGVSAPVGIGMIAAGTLTTVISHAVTGVLEAQANAAAQILSSAVSLMGGVITSLIQVAGTALSRAVNLVEHLTGGLIRAGMEATKLRTTFDVLTGGQGKAGVFGGILGMSTTTPFGFEALSDTAQTLLGMGVSAGDLVQTMKALGDVAVGDEGRLKRLAIVYGEVLAEGKMTGWRIRQLASLGVGVEDMAATMGVSGFEFRRRMSAELVPSDILGRTINRLQGPGGRMAGISDAVLNTPGGRWRQLTGTVGAAMMQAGEAFNQSAGFSDTFLSAASSIHNNMGSIVEAARKAGEYVKALVDEFVRLGKAIAAAVGKFNVGGKLFGIDWDDPVKMAEQLRDAFVGVAEEVSVGIGQALDFVSEHLKEIVEWIKGTLLGAIKSVTGMIGSAVGWGQMDPALGKLIKGFLGGPEQDILQFGPGAGMGAGRPFKAGTTPATGLYALIEGITAPNMGGGHADAVKRFWGNVRDGLGGPDFVDPPNLIPAAGAEGMPVRGYGQWKTGVLSLMSGYRKLSGEEAIVDRLSPAATRGSTEAYEAFARTAAAGLEPQDIKGQIERALGILEDQRRFEERTVDEIMKLPQAFRDQVFGQVDLLKDAMIF